MGTTTDPGLQQLLGPLRKQNRSLTVSFAHAWSREPGQTQSNLIPLRCRSSSCSFPGGVPAPRPRSHAGSCFPASRVVPSSRPRALCAPGSGTELPQDSEVFPFEDAPEKRLHPRGGPPLQRLLPIMPGLIETSRSLCFPSSEKIESYQWLMISSLS